MTKNEQATTTTTTQNFPGFASRKEGVSVERERDVAAQPPLK